MKIHNTKKREMAINYIIQWAIGFGILFIVYQLGMIAKMLIWGA